MKIETRVRRRVRRTLVCIFVPAHGAPRDAPHLTCNAPLTHPQCTSG